MQSDVWLSAETPFLLCENDIKILFYLQTFLAEQTLVETKNIFNRININNDSLSYI